MDRYIQNVICSTFAILLWFEHLHVPAHIYTRPYTQNQKVAEQLLLVIKDKLHHLLQSNNSNGASSLSHCVCFYRKWAGKEAEKITNQTIAVISLDIDLLAFPFYENNPVCGNLCPFDGQPDPNHARVPPYKHLLDLSVYPFLSQNKAC